MQVARDYMRLDVSEQFLGGSGLWAYVLQSSRLAAARGIPHSLMMITLFGNKTSWNERLRLSAVHFLSRMSSLLTGFGNSIWMYVHPGQIYGIHPVDNPSQTPFQEGLEIEWSRRLSVQPG